MITSIEFRRAVRRIDATSIAFAGTIGWYVVDCGLVGLGSHLRMIATLANRRGRWPVLAAMLVLACLMGVITAQVGLRHRRLSLRACQVGLAVTALIAIGIKFWRREVWKPAFANFMLWYGRTLQALAMAVVILSVLAWKRANRDCS